MSSQVSNNNVSNNGKMIVCHYVIRRLFVSPMKSHLSASTTTLVEWKIILHELKISFNLTSWQKHQINFTTINLVHNRITIHQTPWGESTAQDHQPQPLQRHHRLPPTTMAVHINQYHLQQHHPSSWHEVRDTATNIRPYHHPMSPHDSLPVNLMHDNITPHH